MKKIFLIISLLISTILFSQNNNNAENRKDITDMNQVKGDSLITNTYNLDLNLNNSEPASPTNIFQDPRPENGASWKNFKRDQAGNIVYTDDDTEHNPYSFENNGKVRWQDQANWSSREKQGMWQPMPYSYVSEDDVMWAKRVTRLVILNEPANVNLKYPEGTEYTNHPGFGAGADYFDEVLTGIDARKNLFVILKDAALSGQINVYNRRMSRLYSDTEISGITSEETDNIDELTEGLFNNLIEDQKSVVDLNTGITQTTRNVELQEVKTKEVKKYEIVEDWFFDKRRSKLDVRIVSITPIAYVSDKDMIVLDTEKECGTFYYPEIRRLLANHKIYNTDNMMDRMSFDEFFQRRLFSSHIVKESNVYDRRISDYINPTDQLSQLWEGERIKENIRSFESSMWEY